MSTAAIVLIVVIALVVVAAVFAVVISARRRRRAQVQERFGPEWNRAVDKTGSPRAAETELKQRVERREDLDICSLPAPSRDRYQQQWREIQGQFVDQPAASLTRADAVITEAMHESGYPMESFSEKADMVSVDHPRVVEHYRKAHEVFLRNQTTPVSTEEVRRAFVSYRALLSDLLEVGEVEVEQPADAPLKEA